MLQKSSIERTTEVFFIEPTKKHSLADISRSIRLAHTSVKKNLNDLAKIGIIKGLLEKKGRRKFPIYSANTDSKLFKRYKVVHNILSILGSGLIEFIEERATPKSVVLFGSYQRGEDTEESDIDLFVECKKEDLDTKIFQKRLRRKIELHFKEDFTSYPKELKNNIINGIVLSGFLEGYK